MLAFIESFAEFCKAPVSAEILAFIEILAFFADDTAGVNPLIHQGPVPYRNFNQTVQIRGRKLIANFLAAVLHAPPDCRDSRPIHAVGGSGGGGFEWKARGLNGKTVIDRTYRMDIRVYDAIMAGLSAGGVVDQQSSCEASTPPYPVQANGVDVKEVESEFTAGSARRVTVYGADAYPASIIGSGPRDGRTTRSARSSSSSWEAYRRPVIPGTEAFLGSNVVLPGNFRTDDPTLSSVTQKS